jgi:hypothetical protein
MFYIEDDWALFLAILVLCFSFKKYTSDNGRSNGRNL